MNINKKLFEYIKNSPTPYHAVAHSADILRNEGYSELIECEEWTLCEGGKYFVTRGGSSLIAFRIPKADFKGFMLTAAHSDSPTFRIKENAELKNSYYVRLSTERYGGMLCSTWMDRPLSVAGRVVVKSEDGIKIKLVDSVTPCAIIPNVAIHMNRNANDGIKYNPAVDMVPVFADADSNVSFKESVATWSGISADDILSWDLMLYCPDAGNEWNGIISAPRLDDLQCAFASLEAFITSESGASAPVYCLFDNEEVGSLTKQGADSTFLSDVLQRICDTFGGHDTLKTRTANSFLVSCDNAHAVHPNHPEYSDPNHTVRLNGGIVIKYNANQKYTSDAVSTGIFKTVCEEAGVKHQTYANRADMAGGSTLGNISNAHVSLMSVDVGLPQLAMHSAYECAGAEDTGMMIDALKVFFRKAVNIKSSHDIKME